MARPANSMPPVLDRVLERVDSDRLIDLVVDAVDAYSPTYAEEPATRVFEAALERAEIPYGRMPVSAGPGGGPRANLVIELGPRPATLLWVGHVDTVALADDPDATVGARRDNGVLHGLGTADMKAGCAAAIEAVIALVESGIPLRRGLAVALVVGEEEYGDGAQALLERMSAPVTIVGEPTGLVPCLDHYGYVEYRLVAEGNMAHAALPEVGHNAIRLMLEWLGRALDALDTLPATAPTAINLRHIRGGEDRFVVPNRCEALLDVHVPPGHGFAPVRERLEAARAGARTTGGAASGRLSCEQTFAAEGFAGDPDDPAWVPIRRAFERTGVAWQPGSFRSHSDAGLFADQGSRVMVCGPGHLERAHTAQECVSLEQVVQAARLYAAMFVEACAGV